MAKNKLSGKESFEQYYSSLYGQRWNDLKESFSLEPLYATFKFESGVHRVQRVPETESQGRVHTSTSTVAILPEMEDADVEINEKDIRIDLFRSSGAGG